MNRIWILLSIILVLVAGLATTGYVSAAPSADFHQINDDVFDSWEICRTRAFGEDGFYQVSETTFRPVIAFESLGENAALAYSLGQQIASKYTDRLQRAEAIFHFVQDRVNYTPDIDQFDYEEFALNADELATAIDQNGVGYGDCEDSAILLAAYEIGEEAITSVKPSATPSVAVAQAGGGTSSQPFSFISIIGFLWLMSLFRRRRRRVR